MPRLFTPSACSELSYQVLSGKINWGIPLLPCLGNVLRYSVLAELNHTQKELPQHLGNFSDNCLSKNLEGNLLFFCIFFSFINLNFLLTQL